MPTLLEDKNRDYKRLLHTPQEQHYLVLNGFQPVASSNVSAVGVNDDDLMIRFHNGSVYRYFNMADDFESVMLSFSKGKWVWRHLRRAGVPYMKEAGLPLPDDLEVDDFELFDRLEQQQLERLGAFVGGIEATQVVASEYGNMRIDKIGGIEVFRLLA